MIRPGINRTHLNRPSISLDGLFIAVQGRVDIAQAVPWRCVGGVMSGGPVIGLDGFRTLIHDPVNSTQIIPQDGFLFIAFVAIDGLLIVENSRLQIAPLLIDQPQTVVRPGKRRVEFNGSLIGPDGFLVAI